MKCIQDSFGNTMRVPDEDAHKLVSKGMWRYVPKHVWKAAGRP